MIRLVAAWMLVNGLLLAPIWVSGALTDATSTPWLSAEAALIAGGMGLLPRKRWSRALAWVVAAGVVLLAAATLADQVFREGLGRPLNLSLDLYLLDAVYRLAVGNTGSLRTLLGIGAIVTLGGASVLALAWLLSPAPARAGNGLAAHDAAPVPRVAAGIVVGTLALALLGLGVQPIGRRVVAPASALLLEQATLFCATRAERVAFASDLETDPARFAGLPGLLEGLDGRNVVVAYLESYGVAALQDPQFAAVVRPLLESAAARLDSAGISVVTGALESPTLGGQSWYAHGTMLSGLWLENQLRYELLLASGRETLVDDFRRAGYRTATVMPAITTAWPEAVLLGYDDVYTSQSMAYAGPPLYWVTMPDQYTWSFVGDVLGRVTEPLFVETAMVSSHAPWTPVLPILDWDELGDGSAFERYRLEGYPPEELWWDVDALRENYGRSLAYSLDVAFRFAERFLDERTLLIVSGDHQAAPWVTGVEGSRVPVHVIARDAAVLEPFLEWGFRVGVLPDPERTAPRMDEFRGWFVQAFSAKSPARPAAP